MLDKRLPFSLCEESRARQRSFGVYQQSIFHSTTSEEGASPIPNTIDSKLPVRCATFSLHGTGTCQTKRNSEESRPQPTMALARLTDAVGLLQTIVTHSLRALQTSARTGAGARLHPNVHTEHFRRNRNLVPRLVLHREKKYNSEKPLTVVLLTS